jgi:hypothetical protein
MHFHDVTITLKSLLLNDLRVQPAMLVEEVSLEWLRSPVLSAPTKVAVIWTLYRTAVDGGCAQVYIRQQRW